MLLYLSYLYIFGKNFKDAEGKNNTVVLGTAGSGKTTIALLRALHLSKLPGDESVLLVNFNGH